MTIRDWWVARPRRARAAVAAASAAVVVAIVAGSAVAGTDGGADYDGLARAAADARAAAATSTSSTSVPTTTTSTSTTAPPAPPAPAASASSAGSGGGTSGGSSSGGVCDPYCSTITDVPPPPDSEVAQRVEETGSAVPDYDGRYQVDQTTGEVVDTGNASLPGDIVTVETVPTTAAPPPEIVYTAP